VTEQPPTSPGRVLEYGTTVRVTLNRETGDLTWTLRCSCHLGHSQGYTQMHDVLRELNHHLAEHTLSLAHVRNKARHRATADIDAPPIIQARPVHTPGLGPSTNAADRYNWNES
jgi:hypothetical protein